MRAFSSTRTGLSARSPEGRGSSRPRFAFSSMEVLSLGERLHLGKRRIPFDARGYWASRTSAFRWAGPTQLTSTNARGTRRAIHARVRCRTRVAGSCNRGGIRHSSCLQPETPGQLIVS